MRLGGARVFQVVAILIVCLCRARVLQGVSRRYAMRFVLAWCRLASLVHLNVAGRAHH